MQSHVVAQVGPAKPGFVFYGHSKSSVQSSTETSKKMKRGNDILIITSNQVKKQQQQKKHCWRWHFNIHNHFFFLFFKDLFRCLHVKVKHRRNREELVLYEFNSWNQKFKYFLYVKNENENMDSNIFSWWFSHFIQINRDLHSTDKCSQLGIVII